MSDFLIKPNEAYSDAENLNDVKSVAMNLSSQIYDIRNNLSYKVSAGAAVGMKLQNIADAVYAEGEAAGRMSQGLTEAVKKYSLTEISIIANRLGIGLDDVIRETVGSSDAVVPGDAEKLQGIDSKFVSNIVKLFGGLGAIGGIVKGIDGIVRSDNNISKIIKGGKDIIGGISKIFPAIDKGSSSYGNWAKALLGFGQKSYTGAGDYIDKFFESYVFKDNGSWSDGIKVGAKWAGVALTAVADGISNYDEFKDQGSWSNPRMYKEMVLETGIDVGKNLVIGAGVAAGMVAICGSAPVIAVGAAVAGVSIGLDFACKNIWGKGLTETISDGILDGEEWVENNAQNIISDVGNAVSSAGNAVASWFGNAFAWAT